MRIFNLFIVVIIGSLIMVSCGSPEKDLQSEIKNLEDSLFADPTKMIDKKMAQRLITKYIEFADVNPADPEAAGTLFKAGDMAMNLNMPQQAIQVFDRIMDTYPDFEKTPQCLFLKGYVYENDYKDLDKAKLIYEDFLMRYPDDEFADDAAISIQNLGKSPEELIKEFEEQASQENEI